MTGTNLTVHQIWYDNHIESDTGSLDPTAVWNTPWTITYIIDVLSKGADDFAPYIMYFDKPAGPAIGQFGPPNAGMDGTFFPMKEGYRYTIVMNMAPGKYYNLTYTWGWREHPPRVQVSEDAIKMMGAPATARSPAVPPKSLAQWEIDTFTDPVTHQFNKDYAIAQIGELAPEKRMWSDFKQALASSSSTQVKQLLADAMLSFDDWQDRTHLPRGVQADPLADVTLLYVNNTIYGSNGQEGFPKWTTRPAQYNVTLFNGDHYEHGYMNVDFGGARGWENQFQAGFNPQDDTPKGMPPSTSTGCTFTFGRHYWWINAGGPWGGIIVDPVEANGTPGKTKVQLNLNFDPPKRLKLYQFDPLHHDVAVFSLH